jgi:Mg-chelatase subunit ChlD
MARRRLNVFGLSFLDAMTCGLGAVILLYMVINASVRLRADRLTVDLQSEVDRLQAEVLDANARRVELLNAVNQSDDERVLTQGLSRRLIETLEEIRVELATFSGTTLARREHINRLMADIQTMEDEAKRLSASLPSEETPGRRERGRVGDGDRQYLTGLKVGGERILFLVDTSASMLDETIVNIIRRRNLSDAQRIHAEKWQQAVAAVDWLTTQIPRESRFQIYGFAEKAEPLVEGTGGTWLDGSDRESLDRAMASLRAEVPGGGTSLQLALRVTQQLRPRPDNLILITDGLPTQGEKAPIRKTVSAKRRYKLFGDSIKELPRGLPVNTLLLPIEGDPMASTAYWKLAIATGGSFMSLSEDWP